MLNSLSPNPSTPILITGGTGFAGSHLVELLENRGFTNIHVTSFSSKPGFVHDLLPADHIHTVDLTSFDEVRSLLKTVQPTHIYHLAAISVVGDSFNQAREIISNNLILQLNLLEAIREVCPGSRTLIVGSAMEYDLIKPELNNDQPIDENHQLGPSNPYGVSKVAQDLLGLSYYYSYKLDIVRARPFNHLGERQTPDFAIPSFARQIVAIERGQQQEIKVGNLDASRDFSDVKDVVAAYVLLMEKGQSGEVYNIGAGQKHTVKAVLEMLIGLAHQPINVISDPDKIRPLDVPSIVADNGKIAALGWQPHIPLPETLQRVLEYWRNQS